jgi:hypothetical protein
VIAFTYEPTDTDLIALTKMKEHEGWEVFAKIMQQAYNDAAVGGIEELSGSNAHPAGFYSGYLTSIKETLARVDFLTEDLKRRLTETNTQRRMGFDREGISPGGTAS